MTWDQQPGVDLFSRLRDLLSGEVACYAALWVAPIERAQISYIRFHTFFTAILGIAGILMANF